MTIETSTSTDRVAAVGAIYAAFGRGDVPAILDQLAADVQWEPGIRPTDVPWLQPGTGTAHVAQFFTVLGGSVDFLTFEPVTIAGAGDEVVAVIREAATVRATGKHIPEDLYVHHWRFRSDGKVASFRHIGDWHRHEVACQA
jgi:ketosteroid isomerase-like protein